MNKFEFKNLVKNLKDTIKERTFFKDLRKEVETGANGTQDYVVYGHQAQVAKAPQQ